MSLYVLGSNIMGQLALPEEITSTNRPQKLDFFENKEIVKIAVGKLHTLVLCKDNELYSWGINDDLSLGRDGDERVPSIVDFPHEIIDICGGASYSAILTSKGHVYGCGTFKSTSGVFGFDAKNQFQKRFVRMVNLSKITRIYPGHNHLVMLDSKNNIWTVGANESGQLGRKSRVRNIKRSLEACQVSTKLSRKENHSFARASGGGFHSMAVNDLCQCFGWGSNFNGQLGIGTVESSEFRKKVELENIMDVKCGLTHTLFLTNDGKVYGCGDNSLSQLGIEGERMYSKPMLILEGAGRIRSGSDFGIAQIGQRLYSWGSNLTGELGFDELEHDEVRRPREIDFDFGEILDYGCGSDFTIVLTK